MFSLLALGCGLGLQKQTEEGFLFVSFCFFVFAMEILKRRDLHRCGSVRGRKFPWFGENISPWLSERWLPRYFWVAMAAESIFILAFFVLWRFLLLLPSGEEFSAWLHRQRVTPSVTGARANALGPTAGLAQEHHDAGGAAMWPAWTKHPYLEKEKEIVSWNDNFAATSPSVVWGCLMSSGLSFVPNSNFCVPSSSL